MSLFHSTTHDEAPVGDDPAAAPTDPAAEGEDTPEEATPANGQIAY